MVISELRDIIRTILKKSGIEEYEFETKCILEDTLKMPHALLITHSDSEADPKAAEKAVETAKKRSTGYPLQYILGEWDFHGCTFKVGEGVLIPRPDTEILVDTVIEKMRGIRSPRIVDLCSGTGCIAVTLKKEFPDADITAVELSDEAIPFLIENAQLNNTVIRYIHGDVMNGALLEKFADKQNKGKYLEPDCIVSNPPYLTDEEMSDLQKEVGYEPERALHGGADGLKFYRVIACLWKEILKEGGLMAFEIGYEQGQAVSDIMRKSGFSGVSVRKDLGGNDRVVYGFKGSKK